MKTKLLLSFLATILMVFVMRYQGQTLVTELTPRGIIDLEFARTPEKLLQLQAAWQWKHVRLNLYLDLIFILTYVWFFATEALRIKKLNDWTRAGYLFVLFAFIAGLLDLAENCFMYLAFTNSAGPGALELIYYYASAKFFIILLLIIYLFVSLPFVRKSSRQKKVM